MKFTRLFKYTLCAVVSSIALSTASNAHVQSSPASLGTSSPISFNVLENASDYRIAFGSCAKERLPQPIWHDIAQVDPDVFLFIGDNQYADIYFDADGDRVMAPVTDPARFTEAYKTLSEIEGFKKFRESTPIYAMWDDHDYGANDGGKDYPLKKESQKAFVEFFGFPEQHPIHKQEGIYHEVSVERDGKTIQMIFLDTRYHRDSLDKHPQGRPKGKGPYLVTQDKSRSILGETQWQWFEQQLQKPADIRFIISSIQVVAYEHGWETWGNMPHEKERLYAAIEKANAENVIFLSGDRHLMELSKDTGQTSYQPPYPIYDFTSSGMTQEYREVNEANSFRIGEPVRDTHYAVVDIIWGETIQESRVVLTALGLDNKVFLQHEVNLSELSF